MNGNKNKAPLAVKIAMCSAAAGFVMIFYGARTGEAVPAFIGTGLFIFAPIVSAVTHSIVSRVNGSAANGGSTKEAKKTAEKYLPLLLDERTKQHPEIQRLLQYIEVQKAFFDPSYIQTAQAQNEPNVQELMEVFDKIIAWQETNGTAPLPNGGAPLGSFDPLAQQRRQKEQSTPRRKAGRILIAIGFLIVISPFLSVMFFRTPDSFQNIATFAIAPVGFAFLIIGTVMKNMK